MAEELCRVYRLVCGAEEFGGDASGPGDHVPRVRQRDEPHRGGVPVESPIIVGCGLRRLGAAAHGAACHGGDGVGFPVDEEQGSGPPPVGGWRCGEKVFWCWLGCGDDEGGVEKPGGFVEQPVDHVPAVGKTRPKHPARAFETVYEFREIFYVVCA